MKKHTIKITDAQTFNIKAAAAKQPALVSWMNDVADRVNWKAGMFITENTITPNSEQYPHILILTGAPQFTINDREVRFILDTFPGKEMPVNYTGKQLGGSLAITE